MDIQHNSWIKLLANSLIKLSKNASPLPQFIKKIAFGFTSSLGTQSLRLKKRLNKLFKEQLPSGKFVFRTNQRMSSCFRFKDANPRSLLSGIIYKYKCPRSNSRDGSTYRYWAKRLEEHLHMSSLSGKSLKRLQSFAPMLHGKDKFCINNSSDDFCIIGKEKDQHLVRLK